MAGNLWVCTNNGIALYLEKDNKFINYGANHGLKNAEFKTQASTISLSGDLYFGGTHGITWISPLKREVNTAFSGIVLSKLMLFNEEVSIGKAYASNSILSKSLQVTDEIRLNYNQNSFSIFFDALEFVTPEQIKYEYILNGLDQNWQKKEDGNKKAVYTNVPHGKYTFTVKAFSSPNNFHTKNLTIHILPPWWLTWWAKMLYVLLIVMLLYGVYKVVILREKEKQLMLTKELREQLTQAKLQLFTDISHEIRTPLTLVISPLLKLMHEGISNENERTYQIMYRNATRILRLLNQMLDLRKIDRGQMRLSVHEVDVTSSVHDILDSFTPLIQKKDIQLQFTSENIPDSVWINMDFVDKILYNLLSNAFKFTDNGGLISVSLNISDQDKLEFRVKDNGKGIKPEYIRKIFDRFYQVEHENKAIKWGTGIGLHLTKMLTELHHGSIHVESEIEEGTLFIVRIPHLKENYSQDEISDIPMEYTHNVSDEDFNVILGLDEAEDNEDIHEVRSKNKSTILLVEDNQQIRLFLKNELKDRFNIIEATDGKVGYDRATTSLPDLIITDVMMDGINGVEMTRKLNENINTRNIPIIMLTAKNSLEDSIEGLNVGADAYISKPFDMRYLLVNIVSLLNKKAISKAQHNIDQLPKAAELDIKSADDKLVEKLNKTIEKHMKDAKH